MSAPFFDGKTMEDGRLFVELNKEQGVECPCCQQFAKVYKRQITSTMAGMLILVAKHQERTKEEYTHVKRFMSDQKVPSTFKDGGDFAKLQMWGLIEEKTGARDDGSKHNGYFKVTASGKDFVYRRTRVPCYIMVYNGKAIDYSEPYISIDDALKQKFSYNELMA